MNLLFSRRLIVPGGLLLLCAGLLAGCGDPEEIREYTVTKPPVIQERMLAAMVPQGSQTWFFKLTGPDAAVESEMERFLELVQSVRFPQPKTPAWDLPEKWQQTGSSGMRYATIQVPTPDKTLELTVTTLPTGEGDMEEYRLANVNRWRKQLGLKPISLADLPEETIEIPLKDAKASVVNLLGQKQEADGDQPPFAAMNRPSTTSTPRTPPATPTFDVPAEWSKTENDTYSLAAFEVMKGEAKVRITVTALGPLGGSLPSQVNRWRGQIGLPPADPAELAEAVDEMPIGEVTGHYVELVGPEDAPERTAILGVILSQPGRSWYFKMQGDSALALAEKARFQSFVKSVRFASAKEAGDE